MQHRRSRVGRDHKKPVLVLAGPGRSRLASNVNQLAKARTRGFWMSRKKSIHEACRATRNMRELLIAALGIMPESSEPGRQPAGAKNLALHLLKDENERVEVHEIRGFAAQNLKRGAQ